RHDRQLVVLAGNGRAEHVVADDHVLLEARQRGDHVADGVSGTTRFDDLTDPGGPDHLAELHRRQVAGLVVEPGAGGGVDADIGGAQQRLSVAGFGCRRGDQLGVTRLDQPGGTAAEQDLTIRQFGHSPKLPKQRAVGTTMWEHLWMNPDDDPEARIRQLEQPLADTARASELGGNQPPGYAVPPPPPVYGYGEYGGMYPPPASASSGNRVFWIVGAMFVVGILILVGGIAAFA